MNQCDQCGADLKPGARSCRECGWGEKSRAVARAEERWGTAWSPPTPPVTIPEWEHGPRWQIPPAIAQELEKLHANLTVPAGSGAAVDPEQERTYLANCAARKRELGDEPLEEEVPF